MDKNTINDTHSYIMKYIANAVFVKQVLQISDDIILRDGKILCIGCNESFDTRGICDNILNGADTFIYDTIRTGGIPTCKIEWYIQDPIFISSDYILDLFEDDSILEIFVFAGHGYTQYVVSTECYTDNIFKRFGKTICSLLCGSSNGNAEKIIIERTLESIIRGG